MKINIAVWTNDLLINIPLDGESWHWKYNRHRWQRTGTLTVRDGKGNVHALIHDARSFRVSRTNNTGETP